MSAATTPNTKCPNSASRLSAAYQLHRLMVESALSDFMPSGTLVDPAEAFPDAASWKVED